MTHYLNDLAFIARQYNALLANGLTSKQALKTLDIALADSRGQAWLVWQHLIDSGANVLSVRKRDSFTQLLCRIKEHQGDLTHLPSAIERGVGTLVINAQRFWMGLSSSLFYFFAVMMVALLCWAIYLLHILPTFKVFFTTVGADLPLITQRLLQLGEYAGFGLLSVVMITVLLALWAVIRIHHAVQHMQPLIGGTMWIPGLKQLAGLHNQQLLVAAAAVVADTVHQEHPVQLAAEWLGLDLQRHVPHDLNPAWRDLLLADHIGTASAELKYWLSVYPDLIEQQLSQLSRVLMSGLQLLAVLTVATLLMAIYLPLFSLADALL